MKTSDKLAGVKVCHNRSMKFGAPGYPTVPPKAILGRFQPRFNIYSKQDLYFGIYKQAIRGSSTAHI